MEALPESCDILREDGPLLAVNKPAGLPTQAPPGLPSLEAAVKAWLKAKHAKPGNVYLGIPHRLDRPVSGVVVFAKNSKAAARLAEQFAQRRVRKTYRAVVEGELPESSGTLTDFVTKVPDESRAEIARPGDAGAREAVLSYHVLERAALSGGFPATVVEIILETGRMHQIRVQFASRGFPVAGDAKYGARSRWDAPGQVGDCASPSHERIALHAQKLALFHPVRYDEVVLEAPLPPPWEQIARDVAPDA
jgi:23S rRNA pseudouridine1911/1915/1917 synthase